jgi:hypothetical protein
MRTSLLLALVVATPLAGCGERDEDGGRSGATIPARLVALYDEARPDGMIEIEADRDGGVVEMEAEVAVDALPAKVRESADKVVPGGRIIGAEIEYVGDRKAWEVQKDVDGKKHEIVMTEDGTVLEREIEIAREDAPQEVLDAATRAIEGGTFKSVERIEIGGGSETRFHVKLERDGASYKVVLAPSGNVLRKVREAKAEIEIPLR